MKDAIILTIESVRTRASTSEALITFALPLEHADKVSHFMSNIGQQVGAAFAEIDQYTTQKESPKGDTRKSWQERLWLHPFLRNPAVWKAAGTDEEFLEFLRGQPCAYCNNYNLNPDTGDKVAEAAHVRRIANGAGVSIKPDYSAISLCRDHHRLQHNEGESALGDEEWWARKRIHALRAWVWDTMKRDIGVDSMKKASRGEVLIWAKARKVSHLLPVDMS